MLHRLTFVFCIAAVVRPAPAQPNSQQRRDPQMAVYRWATKPGNADVFGQWVGRPDVWGEDFVNFESWDNIRNPGWLLKPWAEWVKARDGRRWLYGLPLLVGAWDRSGPTQGTIDVRKPVSYDAGARGEYNEHYRVLAENLVKLGLADKTIIRLGWEFNGGWYTWRVDKQHEAFAEYWRQVVKTMRGVPGAGKLEFCWNPALGHLQFPSEKAWPGDEYVDYVGVDVYDDSWLKDTYPWPEGTPADQVLARRKKVWAEAIVGGDHGLAFWSKFAREHKKPLAVPEWGVSKREDRHGGLDNAYFVEQMHAFLTDPANPIAFHCYFDVEAPDGHHQLSPGEKGTHQTQFPEAAAAFKRLFGRPAPLPAAP